MKIKFNTISSNKSNEIDNYDIGLIGTDSKGNVLWSNMYIQKVFELKDIDNIINKNLCKGELCYKNKNFKVHSIHIDDSNNKKLKRIIVLYDNTDYKNLLDDFNREKNYREILDTILEIVYDGIVVIDNKGKISMISSAYAEFLQIDKNEVIGKDVIEIIENTRLHIVIKNGQSEMGELQNVKGRYIIASRVPIIKDGIVKGAVGKVLFRNVRDFNALYNRIKKVEKFKELYNSEIRSNNTAIYSFGNIIGNSVKIQHVKDMGKKAALTNSNVLLTGESGTGKELFAHAIHNASDRVNGNFVKINCAAIPRDLLESELFGYEKGSFTGANKEGKIGKFELADGGTIFLDEIGDMPLYMQAKLLRVLQEKEVERIGSIVSKRIDIRVIAATNKNLKEMVQKEVFREDLYYRLNVVNINIPPLRDRKEDIILLTNFLINKICVKLKKKVNGISKDALECLKNYVWEGNVRQLENVLERAINIVTYGKKIEVKHLDIDIEDKNLSNFKIETLEKIMEDAEKKAILNALNVFNGNRTKVAKALNISRTTLYQKMSKYKFN